ncbi:hypothetical protein ACJX0J_011739, partial [Zea mays]
GIKEEHNISFGANFACVFTADFQIIYMYLNVYVIQLNIKNKSKDDFAFLTPQKNEITLSIYKIAKQQFTKYQKSMTIGKLGHRIEVKSHCDGIILDFYLRINPKILNNKKRKSVPWLNKACLVAYLDLATSLNGINRIEVRNSMPSIGKHKNIALKEFNRMPIRASGNKASHIEKLDHGLHGKKYLDRTWITFSISLGQTET